MLIYIVRHGETDWNAEGRLQGQKDIALNERGRAQATRNGLALQEMIPDPSVYDFVASPLSRTRETMERLRAAMGLDPSGYRTDERLLELSFGDWEGYTLEEVHDFAPDRLVEREEQKWSFIPPGADAESYEILSWRVAAWLKSLDRPTICVAHGGVIRSIFRLVADVTEEEASKMDVPQDRILEVDLDAGSLAWH